jgi:aspartyl-tRNA(Asn)/glutamyl-tRNA(Gln) amidotransferase subunit A
MAAMASPTELTDFSVIDAVVGIARGETTSVELTEACLARIAATDGDVEAWTTVQPGAALAEARQRDEAVRARRPIKSLHGVPIGVKDIVDVAGMPTTAGGPPFAHSRPTRDATLVARLRAAGAVIVGKTVATPFAFKDPAATRNPWALDHTPGGSSSGSAAAVAARHVPAAIGTQTIGSILRPAAFCGVVGLKGDHGAVPLDGVLPLAGSLDHAGPITRTVPDATLVLSAMVGRVLALPAIPEPRFALPQELVDLASPGLRVQLERVVERLERVGAAVVRESLPVALGDVMNAGWVVLEAEAAAQHRSWFARHAAEYPPQIAGLVEAGVRRSPAEVDEAQRIRGDFRHAIGPWLATFDAVLSPTAPGPAPLLGAGTGDPSLCAPWSYAGVPAISIPTGLDAGGLPLAIQLVAGPGRLERLLGAAAWCEVALRFFDVTPPMRRQ